MPGRRTCPPVGIDLGTTYSCVAVWQNGRVAIISNDLGCRVTPSYVAFTDTQRLVGEAAKSQAHRNGENTIYDAKRLIGRKFSDTVVQGDMQLWPFKVYKGTADKPVLKVQHEGKTKEYAPQQISSMVLARMKKFAEDFLDGGVTQAVITVPAYFNDAQRSATVEAGKIAGLEVLRIISEPVAAALTYGLQRHHVGKSKVVIYDLGGGTCDVSALEIEGGDFNVLAKDGDTHLGGEDFDRCLVDHFVQAVTVQEIRKKYRVDLSSDRRARRRLHGAAEVAKRTLSSMDCATVEVDSLIKGDDFFTTITCARFEDLCEDLFQRCMLPVTRCLDAAGLKPHQVDEVVLVGGSTRIPRIQSLLEMLFDGKSLNKTVNPDEAVAHGAAVQAAMLTDTWSSSVIESLRLQDVTPLSLGLRCYGDKFSVVIPRNAKVPASATLIYNNARDVTDKHSACIAFPVHEGERSVASLNDKLGSFSLHDLPLGPKGSHLFEVTFTIDSDGILTVTSKHKGTDNWKAITIDHSSGRHTEQEVQKMIEEAERYRREDEAVLVKQKAKNELSEYVYGIKNALRAGLESDLQRFDASALVKSKDRIMAWMDSGSDLREADEYCSRRSELEALCSCAIRNAISALFSTLQFRKDISLQLLTVYLDTEWRPSDKVMIAAGKEMSTTIKEAVKMATV